MAKSTFRNMCFVVQEHFFSTSALSKSTSTVKSGAKSTGTCSVSTVSVPKEIRVEQNAKLVLDFLKSQGFSDAQAAALARRMPNILRCKLNTVLKPKIEFLVENGFSGSLLYEMVLTNPAILRRGLNSYLKPSLEFLREFLGTDEKVKAMVKRTSLILTHDLNKVIRPNIQILMENGVPLDGISKLITQQPRFILVTKVETLACNINKVKELGLEPESLMFLPALKVVSSMSSVSWDKKLQVFKSLGWTEDQVRTAFKHQPSVMGYSESKLRRTTDFLVSTLKLRPDWITNHPKFFTYSLESRLYPRHSVIKVLKSRKLLKGKLSFATVFGYTENDFSTRYVLKYSNIVPELPQIYSDSKVVFKRQDA